MIKLRTANTFDAAFPALGTVNRIRSYGPQSSNALEQAASRVEEIHHRMSAFQVDSDLGLLRRNAGNRPVRLHADTCLVLQKAQRCAELSGGAFDCTAQPLTELWGIGKKGDFIPDSVAIQKALRLVDFHSLELDIPANSAFLQHPGQAVNLGGIAKGYAADEVRRVLLENGVHSALINLGGNISVLGNRPDGHPWVIGIQNPTASTGEFLGTLTVSDCTVVTSGCNEQFFMHSGTRYHHIFDPRSGQPVHNGLLSVTAVCHRSVDADALTTALFVLGPEAGAPLLQAYNAEALFIFENLSFIATRGLYDCFRPIQQKKAGAL